MKPDYPLALMKRKNSARWTVKDVEDLLDARKKGVPGEYIARLLGKSIDSVHHYCNAFSAMEKGNVVTGNSVGVAVLKKYCAKHGLPEPIFQKEKVDVAEQISMDIVKSEVEWKEQDAIFKETHDAVLDMRNLLKKLVEMLS